MKTIYRAHFTCKAGHTTYYDYKHLSSAKRSQGHDPKNWIKTHIEKVTT